MRTLGLAGLVAMLTAALGYTGLGGGALALVLAAMFVSTGTTWTLRRRPASP